MSGLKEVWAMRHGQMKPIQDGTFWRQHVPLSGEGYSTARRAREIHLRAKTFKVYYNSSFRAPLHTISEILFKERQSINVPGLSTVSRRTWNWAQTQYPHIQDEDVRSLYLIEGLRGILRIEGDRTFGSLRSTAERDLAEGERALAVSHGILIECALAHALNEWPPPLTLAHGEIVVFRFASNGRFSELKEYEHLLLSHDK